MGRKLNKMPLLIDIYATALQSIALPAASDSAAIAMY